MPLGRRGRRRLAWSLVALALLVAAVPVAVVQALGQAKVRALTELAQPSDEPRVAIVPGAGLRPGGAPSVYLERRLVAARQLLAAGAVDSILVSGDGRSPYHDEPAAMATWLVEHGVPEAAIVRDPGGLDTHDTCVRAADTFGVTRAVVVTQNYHLRRALFSCVAAGIDAVGVGVSSQSVTLSQAVLWHVRELPASWKAFWDGVFSRAPASGTAAG